jgi:RimJ/RimL family protein N-acetyltransferase
VIVAETTRLRIRHFTLEDAEFILRLLNEPTFIQNIVDKGVRTLDAARAYLRDGPIASYERHGFGLNCVELRDSRLQIGMCGLIKRDSLEDPDIGYALLPEHCSKGYAIEAATAVMATAGGEFGMKRVVAVTNAENERSIRLLERMGFRYERMIALHDGEPEIKLYGSAIEPPSERAQ